MIAVTEMSGSLMDWNNIRYFTKAELACRCGKCGGKEQMDEAFVMQLDRLRERLDRPLTITSGYRCPLHPEEAKKDHPGAHANGTAADIAVSGGKERYKVISVAMELGFVGIGVANSFIHVDSGHSYAARPVVWKYS